MELLVSLSVEISTVPPSGMYKSRNPPPLGSRWLVPRDLGRDRGTRTQSSCDLGPARQRFVEEAGRVVFASQSYINAPQIQGCQLYPGWGDSWLSLDLPRAFPRLGCKRPSPGPQGSWDTRRREGDGEAVASVFGLGFFLKELPATEVSRS